MTTRISMIRAAAATALAGAVFAFAHVQPALPPHSAVSVSIDAHAPLHATLLPIVSVFADATQPDGAATVRIAATRPLSVTLLPTVRVSLHVTTASTTPTIVAARAPRAQEPDANADAGNGNDHGIPATAMVAPIKLADAAPALRARLLP